MTSPPLSPPTGGGTFTGTPACLRACAPALLTGVRSDQSAPEQKPDKARATTTPPPAARITWLAVIPTSIKDASRGRVQPHIAVVSDKGPIVMRPRQLLTPAMTSVAVRSCRVPPAATFI